MATAGGAIAWAWTNTSANAIATGHTLTHTGGGDGWAVAVGNSSVALAGDGYVQLAVGSADKYLAGGLTLAGHVPTTTDTDIDFGIFWKIDATLDVFDGGSQVGVGAPYTAADKFRVTVVSGAAVAQQQSGGVGAWSTIYSYTTVPSGPLTLGAALYSDGASLTGGPLVGAWA